MIKDIIQSVVMGAVFSVKFGLASLSIIGLMVLVVYGIGIFMYVVWWCKLPYCLFQ